RGPEPLIVGLRAGARPALSRVRFRIAPNPRMTAKPPSRIAGQFRELSGCWGGSRSLNPGISQWQRLLRRFLSTAQNFSLNPRPDSGRTSLHGVRDRFAYACFVAASPARLL